MASEILVQFGLLVWFECTDIWYKLFELICEFLTLRFHTPPGHFFNDQSLKKIDIAIDINIDINI